VRRILVLAILIGAGALPRLGAAHVRADDDDVAAARAQVESSRLLMERRYAAIARQQDSLKALAQEIRAAQRDDGLPEWLATDAVQSGMEALAADARDGAEPSRTAAYVPLSKVLPERAPRFTLWGSALIDRVRAFAVLHADAGAAELLAKAILVIADTPPPDAWDGWFQDDPVVVEWRAQNGRLADVLRTEAAARPTEMVRLEKGRFELGPWEGWTNDLGAKDNRRVKVSVKLLHVDRHEVTRGQYHAYLLTLEPAARAVQLPVGWTTAGGLPQLDPERASHPVTGVTFAQARAYARSLGKRLPSEDEWERIAAGGDEARVFPWGSDAKGRSWVHKGDDDAEPVSVTEHPDDVTSDGVLGMAGNVKEMVATYSDRKPVKARVKPGARIVIRGGGFRTRASECQTRWRWFAEAEKSADDVGFRCVMDDAEFRRRGGR